MSSRRNPHKRQSQTHGVPSSQMISGGRLPPFAPGMSIERGAPFPLIHTDTEWDLFPGCGGFQLWYLLALDSRCPSQANMFMVSTSMSTGADPPTAYYLDPGGCVLKTRNLGGDVPTPGAPPTYGHHTPRVHMTTVTPRTSLSALLRTHHARPQPARTARTPDGPGTDGNRWH